MQLAWKIKAVAQGEGVFVNELSGTESYVLPLVDYILISNEPIPRNACESRRNILLWCGHIAGSQLRAARHSKTESLGDKVISDEAEDAVREYAGTDVEVARLASSDIQGLLGEAMSRYVSIRSAKYRFFHCIEMCG